MLNFSSNSSNSCKIPRNFFDDILSFNFDLIFPKAFDFFSTTFICFSNAELFGSATKPFRFHVLKFHFSKEGSNRRKAWGIQI